MHSPSIFPQRRQFRGWLLAFALLLALGCAGVLFPVWAGISNGGVGPNFSAGPYTAYLPNPTYPAAYVIASVASGDVDLYTVPASRKALLLSQVVTNNSGGTINVFIESKISGTYRQLSAVSVVTTATFGADQSSSSFPIRVLAAGETLSVNMTAVGLTVWMHVIEFDASSPLKSVTMTSFAAGNNALYTVPASTTVEILPVFGSSTASTVLRPRVFYGNFSGVNRTETVNHIPSGGAASLNNQILAPTVIGTGIMFSGVPLYGSLAPGDIININVDANTAAQIAWVNVIEH